MRLTRHHFVQIFSGNAIRDVFPSLYGPQMIPAVTAAATGIDRDDRFRQEEDCSERLLFAQSGTDQNRSAVVSEAPLHRAYNAMSQTQLAVVIPFNQDGAIPASRRPVAKLAKRALDCSVSLVVIICLLSWLIPLIGILIRLESRGPVLFKQLRSGLDGRKFWCYKFRSMVVNRDADQKQAVSGDSRITTIGAFLRKTSLDELPQFLNILTGDMTLVGPRPHMLKHTEYYGALIPDYMERLKVKQGLTGWAQVNGYRGETTELHLMQARVEHDNWYITNWSFWLDIRILCMTVLNLFKNDANAR